MGEAVCVAGSEASVTPGCCCSVGEDPVEAGGGMVADLLEERESVVSQPEKTMAAKRELKLRSFINFMERKLKQAGC